MQMYIEKNIPLLCKKPCLNLRRGSSVPEEWVKRSTRYLQDDVYTTLGTGEKIKRFLFQTVVIRSVVPLEHLISVQWNGYLCFWRKQANKGQSSWRKLVVYFKYCGVSRTSSMQVSFLSTQLFWVTGLEIEIFVNESKVSKSKVGLLFVAL